MQVSVSAGGVPKLPVDRAWVGRLGLQGDGHRERTVHGGPHRAVCLFAMEAIERLQIEGHPVEPGSVGENLTTSGVEWSLLPVGTRARIGGQLELELASPTAPCSTQTPNFVGGRYSRISIDLHPADSRMYARVLHEGEVRPGDPITLLPPATDSMAEVHATMNRVDGVEKASSLRLWRAAQQAGLDVRILDDGDICAGASPAQPSPALNHAQGLRLMPQLVGEVVGHFDAAATAGLIPHEPPTAGALPDHHVAVHAGSPTDVTDTDGGARGQAGLAVAQATTNDDRAGWAEVFTTGMPDGERRAWQALLPHLFATRGVYPFIARGDDGRPIGTGLLHVRHATGLLRGAVVVPDARGRGVQQALIGARAALAAELGCTLLASMAQPDTVSSRNLQRFGLRLIETHAVYRYVPTPAR